MFPGRPSSRGFSFECLARQCESQLRPKCQGEYVRSQGIKHDVSVEQMPMSRSQLSNRMSSWITPGSFSITILVGYSLWFGVLVITDCQARIDHPETEPIIEHDRRIEELKQTGTPLERAFANETFQRGTSVERLTEMYPPQLVLNAPQTTVFYYGDISQRDESQPRHLLRVVASDKRLTEASLVIETKPGRYRDILFFSNPLNALYMEKPASFLFFDLIMHLNDEDRGSASMATSGVAGLIAIAVDIRDKYQRILKRQ